MDDFEHNNTRDAGDLIEPMPEIASATNTAIPLSLAIVRSDRFESI